MEDNDVKNKAIDDENGETKKDASEKVENEEKNTKNEETENNSKTIDDTDDKKTDDKEAKVEEKSVEDKLKEADDRYKRLLAEFDNFRKRSEKEQALMIDIGASMILTKILPIVDNFERAINSIPDDLKGNPFVDGVDKIYKQILKTFEEIEVKPIEAVGKPFDANYHNAVMTDENAEGEVDTVVEELQKGYMYKDQVLRHSMVKVKK